jgi:hypothetical protein
MTEITKELYYFAKIIILKASPCDPNLFTYQQRNKNLDCN